MTLQPVKSRLKLVGSPNHVEMLSCIEVRSSHQTRVLKAWASGSR
jgi:hypothetical protein